MKTGRRFAAEAKVALHAIQGHRTIADLASWHELHPNLITQWKRQAIEKLPKVFDFAASGHRPAQPSLLRRCHVHPDAAGLPRGVLHSWVTDKDDPAEDPDFGRFARSRPAPLGS